MKIIRQKFTILNIKKPFESNINQDLQWLGSSLGLFSLRDKDKSCFRIFIELLKSARSKQPISSDELAARLHLTRGTIIFHINKLTVTGIVVSERNKYTLKVDRLKTLVEQIEKDLTETVDNLKEVAKRIDKHLN